MKINFGMTGEASYWQHQLDQRRKPKSVDHNAPGQKISFGKQTPPQPNLFSLVASKDGQGYAQDLQSRAFIDSRYANRLDYKA